jgi:hypothetical protein
VLANQDYRYLETEPDKVSFSPDTLGLLNGCNALREL